MPQSWDRWDFELTPPPSVRGIELWENWKKNSSEPLEIHIDSPVSQKARQNQITYFKSTRKISLGGKNFWNPVMSFLGSKIWFPKRRKFSYFLCFVHLPNCQSLSNGYDFHIYAVSRWTLLSGYCISVTSNQRVKTVIFAENFCIFNRIFLDPFISSALSNMKYDRQWGVGKRGMRVGGYEGSVSPEILQNYRMDLPRNELKWVYW